MLLILLSVGFLGMKKHGTLLKNEVLAEGRRAVYGCVAGSYMPELLYYAREDNRKSGWDFFAAKLTDLIPFAGYLKTQGELALPKESTLSYETILALEAMDESYMDGRPKTAVEAAEEENENRILVEAETENEKERSEEEKTEENKTEENEEDNQERKKDGEDKTEEHKGEEKKAEEEKQEESKAAKEAVETSLPAEGFVAQSEPVVTYPREKLNDFDYLIQNFYTVDRMTTINGSQLNAADLLARDMHLVTPADQPQILIYHTHSQEMYANSTPGDLMTGVMGCGEYLAQLLRERYGLNVIHHMGQYDVDARKYAYANAAPAIEQILAENPSIEVVIDLHRDEINGKHLTRKVQGKTVAPVMFFNGLSRLTDVGDIAYLANPNLSDNLAFSLQMQLTAAEYYPELTRHIYLKGYRYNMHYRPKTLLIENGFQTNTYEEAHDAMEPLADVLYKVLCG